jgi:hypothetical protein
LKLKSRLIGGNDVEVEVDVGLGRILNEEGLRNYFWNLRKGKTKADGMGPGTGCGLRMLAGRGTRIEKGDG